MMMYNDSYCKHKDYIFSYLLVYITILKSVSWHIKVTTIPYSNIYDINRVLSFLVKHEIKYRSEEQKQLSLTKWIMNCLPKKPSWSRLVPAFNVFMCFWPVLLVCKQKARLRLRFSFSILLQCFSLCWNTLTQLYWDFWIFLPPSWSTNTDGWPRHPPRTKCQWNLPSVDKSVMVSVKLWPK